MMRKRERENPCGVCGHFHNHEEGEVCGICGHRPVVSVERTASQPVSSAFPSEIIKDFLYLGSYDNACRGELLRTQGISRILNTVPACQNLYKNSFTYHCLQDDKVLPFDDAIQFLEQCERDKARVLVHCMSGKSRSPAIVMAYLMKSRGWRLEYSLNWVKERRPSVDLFPAVYQQLVDYEQKLFNQTQIFPPTDSSTSFGFGNVKPVHPSAVSATAATTAAPPAFIQAPSTSIFDRAPNGNPGEFIFRAGLEAPMDSC